MISKSNVQILILLFSNVMRKSNCFKLFFFIHHQIFIYNQNLLVFRDNFIVIIEQKLFPNLYLHMFKVLFKSPTNIRRRNKGNVTLKSNSNKIKLCNIIFFFIFIFQVSFRFLCELNNIFHIKCLKRFTFYVKSI